MCHVPPARIATIKAPKPSTTIGGHGEESAEATGRGGDASATGVSEPEGALGAGAAAGAVGASRRWTRIHSAMDPSGFAVTWGTSAVKAASAFKTPYP